jgi:hypothetical protein
MVKSKCTFCQAEIESPRGDKAIELGWHVMEFMLENKQGTIKHTIIACPEHPNKLMPEFDRLMHEHMKGKGK